MSHIYEATWLHVEMVPFTCLVEFVTCRWLIGHVCFALDGRQRGDSSRSWYLHDPIWMSRIQWQGCRFQGASIWATAQLIWMMLPLKGMTLLMVVFYKWHSDDSSVNGRDSTDGIWLVYMIWDGALNKWFVTSHVIFLIKSRRTYEYLYMCLDPRFWGQDLGINDRVICEWVMAHVWVYVSASYVNESSAN